MDDISGMDLMAEIARAMEHNNSYGAVADSEEPSVLQSYDGVGTVEQCEHSMDLLMDNTGITDNVEESDVLHSYDGELEKPEGHMDLVTENSGFNHNMEGNIHTENRETMNFMNGDLKPQKSGFTSYLDEGKDVISAESESAHNENNNVKEIHNENIDSNGDSSQKEDRPPSDDPNNIVDEMQGNTALHNACADVDLKLVQSLTEKGASVHRTNAKDRTMLHELVIGYCSLTTLDRVYEQNNFIEILSLLIKEGVDINDVDISNRTALHYMITKPKSTDRLSEAVKALLMSGARVNIADRQLQTPLHLAVQRGDMLLVEVLIDHGADPNVKDSLGKTPIHLAVKGRRHKAVIGRIAATGVNLDAQDSGKRTPLHIATKAGRLENVDVLLRYGARVDMADSAGNTCIHLAVVHEPTGKVLEKLLSHCKSKGSIKRKKKKVPTATLR